MDFIGTHFLVNFYMAILLWGQETNKLPAAFELISSFIVLSMAFRAILEETKKCNEEIHRIELSLPGMPPIKS